MTSRIDIGANYLPDLTPEEVQARFEASFDHEPKVDLRTPADVAAQAKREGWH